MQDRSAIPVIILRGEEALFKEDAKLFRNYLIHEAGYRRENIHTLAGKRVRDLPLHSPEDDERTPMLLAYFGHGAPDHLAPTDRRKRIPYDALARWMPRRPFVFINDTCYAGTAIAPFKERGLLEHGQLIAATHENAYAYTGVFLKQLLEHARRHQPLRRRRIADHYAKGDVVIIGERRRQAAGAEDVLEEVAEDGTITISIGSIGFLPVKEKTYKRRTPIGSIQYPRREGRTLDSLLYSTHKATPAPQRDILSAPLKLEKVEVVVPDLFF